MSSNVGALPPGPRDLATIEMQYRMSGMPGTDSVLTIHEKPGTILARWAGREMDVVRPAGLAEEVSVDPRAEVRPPLGIELPSLDSTIYAESYVRCKSYLRIKSVLDFIGAIILLVVAAPVMAAVALAIKLTSPGTVLFRQVRVGRDGKDFVLFKFRSMLENVEATSGPVWSGDGDARATPVGRFIRRFHLDELPQALNVLRGEMSLVGPRPERPCFVRFLRQIIPNYDLRHCVKPGITGLAQVCYPYGASVDDASAKLRYELYYGRHISLRLDLLTLAKTVNVVLAGQGS